MADKVVRIALQLDGKQYTAELKTAQQQHQAWAGSVSAAAERAGVAMDGAAARAGKAATVTAQAGDAAAASVARQAAQFTSAAGDMEISARQTQAAMRMLPAQFTDIVTSLSSGMPAWQVAIQQGGQIKDSFGGAGAAAKALGTYTLGLVNPLTLAAAAAGVLGLAYYQGTKEADGYRYAIVMSGNAAGTTIGQLTGMAQAISAVAGTQGAAAQALAQMAGSGAIASDNLQRFTEVALGLDKYVGVPVKTVVGDLEQLGKAPLQASVKLNEQYHYLTAAVYSHIKALDEQGKKEEAGSAAQRAYMDAMEARKNELVANLGSIERAWNSVTGAAKRGWDAILNVGRATTDEQNLAQLRENLARQQERNARPGFKEGQATANLKEEIRLLERKIAMQNANASAVAEQSKQTEALADWDKIVNEGLSKQAKEAKEVAAARTKFKAAGKDEVQDAKELETVLASIREKYKDTSGQSLQSSYQTFLSGLREKLAAQRQELDANHELSASDKLRIQWTEALAGKFKGLTAAQRQLIEVDLQALQAGEQQMKQREGELKLAQMVAAARQQEVSGIESWVKAQKEASDHNLQSLRERQQAMRDEEDAARVSSALNVSLAEAIELVAIKRLQEAQAAKFYEGSEGWQAIQKEIDLRRQLASSINTKDAREAAKKTADEASRELQRVTEQYEQGLTNAAMQGGKSLREYLTGMLRATAFRIVLDPVMRPLAGLLTSVTGASGAAAGQSSAGGLMSMASMVSSAYTALTTGVSSSIAAGFAKLAGSSFGQAIGLSNSTAIMGNNPSAFVPAGGQLTSLGQSIGTGLGMLGSGMAGYGISSAISGGYTTGGNTVNVLSGIASAFLGPIAGVVGGLINRAFGRKLADTGIEGTLGGSAGFDGSSYQFYKGGWLRSDKTVLGSIDPAVDKGLDTAVKQMQVSMAALATSIDAPTAAISSFSQAIKVSFNGLDEAGIQAKIQETLTTYNEALANTFIASLDVNALPSWVARLVGNTDATAVARLQEVAEWPAKLLQNAGTSRDQLAQLYAQGLASGNATAAGQAVADNLVASIEASLLGNASAQVFDIINHGIVTPLLDAIVMGQNVSEALSEASIQKTIEKAKTTAAAFAELFNNAEFQAALEQLRTTVGAALGSAGSALQYTPRYTAALAANTQAVQQATDAQREAEQQAKRIADERKGLQDQIDQLTMSRGQLLEKERNAIDASNRDLFDRLQLLEEEKRIADERAGLEQQWLQAIGATAALRKLELGTIDPANQSLQELIYRLADMGTAAQAASAMVDQRFSGLQRSVEAEKKVLAQNLADAKESLNGQASAAREAVSRISGIFSALQSAIKATAVQSDQLDRAMRSQALATLQDALAQIQSGASIDQLPGIERALETLSQPSDQLFGRFEDYVAAQDEATDVMRKLGSQAGGQLSVAQRSLDEAEKAVSALDKQYQLDVAALDQTLEHWREQIDISRGIDVSVLSVKDAVDRLAVAIAAGQKTASAVNSSASLAGYSAEQIVGGVNYVRDAAARDDVMAVYQGAVVQGLNVDQLTSVINLAGYSVGADDVRGWVSSQGLPALPEAKKFATGGAFTGDGVVQRPTYFDLGQMAEAGPEAIMPLTNIGGRLGVRATGMGDSSAVVGAIAALQVQMERLIAAATATAVHAHDGKKATLELVDRGITVRTSADEPLAIA